MADIVSRLRTYESEVRDTKPEFYIPMTRQLLADTIAYIESLETELEIATHDLQYGDDS